ncbi:MAG: CoA-binding protein [Chloroflexi bacterium]|nr:CoA-binding protein [Chloroflexota bacterium]
MPHSLEYIFHPRSVAVVGASADTTRQGSQYFHILRQHNFPGPVYAVNRAGGEIDGAVVYPSLSAVPGPVDLVISCVPAAAIVGLVDECVAKGVKVLQSYTARFSETGHEEDARLERELVRRAREGGVRVIGPNCMGLYVPAAGLAFKYNMPKEPGDIAFLSQSGGNAAEIVFITAPRGLRFSKVISFGNGTDLNEADLVEYLAHDPETRMIGVYLEGARDGRRLVRALRQAASIKPVVLMKGGRTPAGARAVASHTASLAGSQEMWQALSRQVNAIWVSSLEEMADVLVALRFLPPVRGTRVAVGGGGGGQMVSSADRCEEAGLQVPPLPQAVRERLRELDPFLWDWVTNPTDTSILGGSKLTTARVLQLMAEDENYDVVIANVGETFALDRPEGRARVEQTVDSIIALASQVKKPVAAVMGEPYSNFDWHRETLVAMRERLVAAGLALFPTPGRAAHAIRLLADYYRAKEETKAKPEEVAVGTTSANT